MARVRRTKLVHCLPQALRPDSPSRQVQQALVPSSLFHQIIQLYVFDTGKYLDYFTSKGLNEVGGKNCQSGLKKLVIDPVFWPDFYCLKTDSVRQIVYWRHFCQKAIVSEGFVEPITIDNPPNQNHA